MLRATKGKIEEREKLQSDVERWMAEGNQPTELPGFGLRSSEDSLPRFSDSKKKITPTQARRLGQMGGYASAKTREKVEGY